MLITTDKRGSINLPTAVCKALNLQPGGCLDLSILDGGGLALAQVAVYPYSAACRQRPRQASAGQRERHGTTAGLVKKRNGQYRN